MKEALCQLNQKTYDNALQGVDKVNIQGIEGESKEDLVKYELPDG